MMSSSPVLDNYSHRDHKSALAIVEKHFSAKRGTPWGNIVEVLSMLIEKYEEERFPIGPPTPIDAIKFRMDQLGLENGDLVQIMGTRARVWEVLNGKRNLSIKIIRKLHNKLGIPAEALLTE